MSKSGSWIGDPRHLKPIKQRKRISFKTAKRLGIEPTYRKKGTSTNTYLPEEEK